MEKSAEDRESSFYDAEEADTNYEEPDGFLDFEEDFYGPILRHPYYNEVTEELGGDSASILIHQSTSNGDLPLLSEIPTSPEKRRSLAVDDEHHKALDNSPQDARSNVNDFEEGDDYDPANTCHINYGLLKRYLASLSSKNLERDLGEAPDRFAFYSAKSGFLKAKDLSDLEAAACCDDLPNLMQSGTFWLDVWAPTSLELRVLAQVFRMHPLTLEDLQLDDMREKCDLFEHYFIICLKAIEPHVVKEDGSKFTDSSDPALFSTVNIYVLVSPIGVVSIHHQELKFTSTIVKRIRLLSARSGLIPDWITYGILDDIIDALSPIIHEMEQEVEYIDDSIIAFNSMEITVQTDMLKKITKSRKRITQLLRLIKSKTEVVRAVIKRCQSRLSEDAFVYLRDLQDHVAMMEANLEHQDENLNRCYGNYLAHLSIETSFISNKMSKVMKKLSAVASILIPWSMVTGMWGMNVRVPFFPYGTEWEHSYFPFFFLVSIMTISTIVLYIIGRKRDWF